MYDLYDVHFECYRCNEEVYVTRHKEDIGKLNEVKLQCPLCGMPHYFEELELLKIEKND